jgi:hypothetical protein
MSIAANIAGEGGSTLFSDAPGSLEPVLRAQGLSKQYGPVTVLSDVMLDVLPGEIHAQDAEPDGHGAIDGRPRTGSTLSRKNRGASDVPMLSVSNASVPGAFPETKSGAPCLRPALSIHRGSDHARQENTDADR